MTLNIRIDPDSESSLSDEEDSSGVQVSPPSESESHGYQESYDEWAHLSYPDELKPSDSASRPRTTRRLRTRSTAHGSSSAIRRHSARHHMAQERESFARRARRNPSPDSPESADSAEEYGAPYGRMPQERRFWPSMPQGTGYSHHSSPGQSYVYPNGNAMPHASFVHLNGVAAPSDQLIRLGHQGQQIPYGHSIYGYSSQHPGPSMPPFLAHDRHPGHQPHPITTASHGRNEGHNPSQHSLSHHMPGHGPPPYGPHDMMIPYGPGPYYPFRDPYHVVSGMMPPYYHPYPRAQSPSQVESSESPGVSPADAEKDEAIARLEKLILEERTEREAREAREAAKQAAIEQEAAEQAARDARAAHEKKIAEDAASQARAEAELKAAEEAAKAKKEAEDAAAAAAEAAATAATEAANAAAAEALAAAKAAANPPPPEKKKPIKFKDAVGRKFSFPFDLCCTWKGMEELIRQAFLHIELIGPHVAEGHYDLVGPNGDIILPQVWETVIEPDWTITMHMWPIPEKPKDAEPAAQADVAAEPSPPPEAASVADDTTVTVSEEAKKKTDQAGPKKPRPKGPDPGAFAMWMVGGNRLRLNKALKMGKKPKAVQHGTSCRVM